MHLDQRLPRLDTIADFREQHESYGVIDRVFLACATRSQTH